MRLLIAAAWLVAGPVAAQVMPPDDAKVVILGEIHDNAAHHAEQARLVAALQPRAVVWEMLTPMQLARAAGIDRTDARKMGAALGWQEAGWPDFAMYHPIFLAAGEVLHLGAAVSRADLRRAMAEGALAVMGAGTPGLGPLTPQDQAAREAEQSEAHCRALPADLLPGMVQAQRLRDAAMAQAALQALAEVGAPVVVITGSGHARTDIGIPALIRAADPGVRVWSLGQVEGDPGADPPYDAVIATAPTPREDPCAAFDRSTVAPG